MIQARDGARFPLEALDSIASLQLGWANDLQSDGPVQSRVASAIHIAHPARADPLENLERTEARARDKGHGWFARVVARRL